MRDRKQIVRVAAMSALPLRLTIRLHTARGDHKKTPHWRGLS
ncbi:hypothetical protein ACCQ10_11815 [Xanthomonas sp. NCPPB 1325]